MINIDDTPYIFTVIVSLIKFFWAHSLEVNVKQREICLRFSFRFNWFFFVWNSNWFQNVNIVSVSLKMFTINARVAANDTYVHENRMVLSILSLSLGACVLRPLILSAIDFPSTCVCFSVFILLRHRVLWTFHSIFVYVLSVCDCHGEDENVWNDQYGIVNVLKETTEKNIKRRNKKEKRIRYGSKKSSIDLK